MFSLSSFGDRIRRQLPVECLLCKLPSEHSLPLCNSCMLELPWLQHHCSLCALPMPDDAEMCGQCQQQPPPWQACIASFEYRPPISQLINRFKEHRDLTAGRVLGHMLVEQVARRLAAAAPTVDLIVPVPSHWRRRFYRGFNHSDELALQLGRQLKIPVSLYQLRKVQATHTQQGLTRSERQGNLNRAFEVVRPVNGLKVAVVDDVITTGSTARALTETLLKAGAADVQVWCVARTPAPGSL
ncbi:ComF family protein [Porticoccaceae bacterium LTM1]|nr:ComF family protein [Porticoccaceae bacterium LTM1]